MPIAAINPVWSVLAVNMLPVFGAAVFGWSVLTLMLFYWFENIVLGVINAVKMLIEGLASHSAISAATLVFLLPFFAFHYGLFCGVHGIFLFALFGGPEGIDDNFDIPDLPGRVFDILTANSMAMWSAVLMVAFHLFVFCVDWLANARWKGVEPAVQMFVPYGRIVLVHVTIIFGGFIVLLFGQPILAAALLALLKTGAEVGRIRLTDTRETLAE